MTTFIKNHSSTKMSLRAWEIKRSRESKHDGERRNSDRSKKEKNRTKQNMFEARWLTFVTRLPREIKHNAAEVSSNIAKIYGLHIFIVSHCKQRTYFIGDKWLTKLFSLAKDQSRASQETRDQIVQFRKPTWASIDTLLPPMQLWTGVWNMSRFQLTLTVLLLIAVHCEKCA